MTEAADRNDGDECAVNPFEECAPFSLSSLPLTLCFPSYLSLLPLFPSSCLYHCLRLSGAGGEAASRLLHLSLSLTETRVLVSRWRQAKDDQASV